MLPNNRDVEEIVHAADVEAVEREHAYIMRLLDELDGDVRATAKELGIDRTTLYRLLKKHGIRLRRRVEG